MSHKAHINISLFYYAAFKTCFHQVLGVRVGLSF